MIPFSSAPDTMPLSYWGRVPVYATTLLVVAHGVFFTLVALAGPLGLAGFIDGMLFSTQGILESFQIWQLFTYAFVPWPLSWWFLVEMAMLYFFGQEVEKYLGRRVFLTLYALLIFIPAFFLLLGGIFGHSSVLAGASAIHFCVFVAFAATAPGAQLLFGITAKWCAIGFLIFNSLLLISYQDWTRLTVLWLDMATTVFFLRACGVHSLQFGRQWTDDSSGGWGQRSSSTRKRPASSGASSSSKSRSRREAEVADPMGTIDPILEKISTHGLNSLTPAEKKRLEQARAQLLEREKS